MLRDIKINDYSFAIAVQTAIKWLLKLCNIERSGVVLIQTFKI